MKCLRFVHILARPPPPKNKTASGSPFVMPVTAGYPYPLTNAGVAELAYALDLGSSLGCPVGRSTSHCEFKPRRPHHSCSTTKVLRQ